MLKKLKRLCGDLIIALISLTIIASWFVLPGEAEMNVSYLKGVAPSNGAGRVFNEEIEAFKIETIIDIPETETAEIEPYIAPETASVNYESSTETLAVEEETWVEVIPEADPIISTDIDALIVQVASEFGLPWQLVRAVCYVESGFDPYAKSDHPDYGLMQVWSEVWRSYGYDPNDSIVYDPLTNLRMGCRVLKDKIDGSGGELNYALTRYRFGDGDASARWANGDRTSWYAEEVLVKYYEYLRGEY